MGVQENLHSVQERIQRAAARAGRDAQKVHLLAVSKMAERARIQEAAQLGLMDFGENRVPQLKQRQQWMPQFRWHMIGRLQTNKVKDAVECAYMIHSVDRFELAEEINRRAEQQKKVMPCLLQVNVSGEVQKAGIRPEEAEDFLAEAQKLHSVFFRGLMTMAPEVAVSELETIRPVFRGLRELEDALQKISWTNSALNELSMGMSHDFELAVEEGATMVRVGSAIFPPVKIV